MKRSIVALVVIVMAAATATLVAAPANATTTTTTATVTNSTGTGGQVSRFDVDGNSLDAHDGSLLHVGDTFHLYGTRYACGYSYRQNSSFCGFKVYSSPDLVHWTDRGYILAPGACGFCFRPHVVYNASTGRYVLWADGGGHYLVATSPTPTGIFTAQPDPALAVGGAVDEALFVDDDGTGYVVHNTTQVAAGLTADMVVERLTPDYLTTTGRYTKLGLGDVEAFTVFKRGGVYHALMSYPSCAYCSGGTGEMTATSMLGPWSGAWYDPNGVHQSGRAEPRYRARLVNAGGTLQQIPCVSGFSLTLPGPAGAYQSNSDLDQRSGSDGFRHYCDVGGTVAREQSFVPSRTGTLSAASITTFQGGSPTAPVTLDVLAGATVLSRTDFPTGSVPWAPATLTAHPDVAVVAGHTYLLRLHSATTSGCYGWEYADANPYPAGLESYSTDGGATFTAEPGRDLGFSTDVSATPVFVLSGVPNGFTQCAGEGGHCAFTGTRVVVYGAAGSYRSRTTANGIDCGIVAFGADPIPGVAKSCYLG